MRLRLKQFLLDTLDNFAPLGGGGGGGRGNLIFSCIRRLGSFLGVQNFNSIFFFLSFFFFGGGGGFRNTNIFGGMNIFGVMTKIV